MIDFAVVGQSKSGTTALAEFLAPHPQLCMSVPKGTGHFATDLAAESDAFHGKQAWYEFRSKEAFERTYSHCESSQLTGDASPVYLYSTDAAKNIYRENPETKIIALLRNPVKFMHSLHMQLVNETSEPETDFARAIELEPARRSGNEIPSRVRAPSLLHYQERARYAPQLQRYFETFDRDQILVLIFEEFMANNAGQYRKVLEFLGVDADFVPEFTQVNASAAPRSHRLNKLLNHRMVKGSVLKVLGPKGYPAIRDAAVKLAMRPGKRQAIPPALEQRLYNETADDVAQVSKMLDRDLQSIWGY